MKTEAPLPRPRYRNEAIFRSAERLIASSKKPARKLPSRKILFAAGVLCGIGVSLLLIQLSRERASWLDGASEESAWDQPTQGPRFRARESRRLPEPFSLPPAPSTGATAADIPPDGSAGGQPERTAATGRRASRSVADPASGRVANGAGVATPQSTTAITRFSLSYYLRGELYFADGGSPFTITLALNRLTGRGGSRLQGVVRYARDDAWVASHSVDGTIDGDTITLRETDKIWTQNQDFPMGRSFVLELPQNDPRGLVKGTWSLGAAQGQVTLLSVPPW